MSIKLELITELNDSYEKLLHEFNNFNITTLPFKLNKIYEWWHLYGSINNNRIGENKQPIIVLIYKDEKIFGILPLLKTKKKKKYFLQLTTLEFFSQSFCGHFLNIIQEQMSKEDIQIVLSLLKKQIVFDYINLSYLPNDSLLLKCNIGNEFYHAGKILIPIDKSYEEIKINSYSKNLKGIINKFRRRISESESIINQMFTEEKSEIINLRQQIISVSNSKLLDEGMHSIYNIKYLGESYFNSIINDDRPFCSYILVNGILVSYILGNIEGNTINIIDLAYNREHPDSKKIGFGIIAYDNIILHYSNKRYIVDMGFGLDDYKFRFSKNAIFTKTLIIKGNSFKSKILYNRILKPYKINSSNINDIKIKLYEKNT